MSCRVYLPVEAYVMRCTVCGDLWALASGAADSDPRCDKGQGFKTPCSAPLRHLTDVEEAVYHIRGGEAVRAMPTAPGQ